MNGMSVMSLTGGLFVTNVSLWLYGSRRPDVCVEGVRLFDMKKWTSYIYPFPCTLKKKKNTHTT